MPTTEELLAETRERLKGAEGNLAEARINTEVSRGELAENEEIEAVATRAVMDLKAEVKRLEDLLDQQDKMTVVGMWAQSGGDWKEFQRIERALGFFVPLFRSTSGEGQPDNEMLVKGSRDALAAGHMVSLQMQPKTGDHSDRVGVSYRRIIDGEFDDFLLGPKGFPQYKAIPAGIKMPFEPHSEFNIQKGPRHAQPDVGPDFDYADFVIKLDALARTAGVRNRILIIPSAAGPQWWLSGEWKKWLTPKLMSSGVVDGLAVDFYAKQKNKLRPPDEGTKGVRTVARSFGVPWSVLETGCEEMPGSPNAKAEWFAKWGPLFDKEGHDCAFWTYNITLKEYHVESSAVAFAAFKTLMKRMVGA